MQAHVSSNEKSEAEADCASLLSVRQVAPSLPVLLDDLITSSAHE